MSVFEKLGAFYLGRLYDQDAGEIRDDLLLYDAKDLTTHAVCVGMTGSGKTGLCVSLLEEAAIDGIPTIAIDPKGDLGNLLLTFPKLQAADFKPWVDPGEAARKGQTVEAYAASRADLWRKGLAQWGQDGKRIEKFRQSVDVSIYTPGSNAGLQLKVLRSFAAPAQAIIDDSDAFRDRILSAVSGLLTLLGIDADPIRSREHILLSNLLQHHWIKGNSLDVAGLIREIQAPPFDRVGVMDLDTFFPAKDRLGLSMSLNNLLASPGFHSWMEGEPLDIQRLLWTAEGKPRISILSIAHLSESERMFFVSLLLNEVVSWVRSQSGTSSLRALLYMDEVFGYFPPTANPPSKPPMLTLLKQARAYGLGVVLATQNPADLDYKGLSNTGTWFLGRLQAERDKMRVLEGLEGASAAAGSTFNRQRMEATLAGLKSRVFLMNNVHEDQPALFHTRWALSYLRGPLTRSHIKKLMLPRRDAAPDEPMVAASKPPSAAKTQEKPALPPGIAELFVPRSAPLAEGDRLVYRPNLLGTAQLHFARATYDLDSWRTVSVMAPLDKKVATDPWKPAEPLADEEVALDAQGEERGTYQALPAAATNAKRFASWEKMLKSHLYRTQRWSMWKCADPKAKSLPDENQGDFRARLVQLAREGRDVQTAKLEKKYAPKLKTLQERIRKAEARVEKEQAQYGQQKMQTAISIGATVLGALFGRKAVSVGSVGRASTAMRGAGRAAREKGDISRAREDLAAEQKKLSDLESQFQEALEETKAAALDPASFKLEEVPVSPRKSDTDVTRVALVWTPWKVDEDGIRERAFE